MSVKSFYYIVKVLIIAKVEVWILVEDLNVYIEMVEYIYYIVYLVFGMWGISVEGVMPQIWLIVWCVWVCDESHIGYLLGRSGLY